MKGRPYYVKSATDYDLTVPYTPAEIVALRRRHNLTAGRFSSILGVHRITVVQWETERRIPRWTHTLVMRLFDLYPELFLDGDTEH